jgi:protein-tyrosine phosphatase
MPVVSLSTLNAINKIIGARKFGENIPHASEIELGLFVGDATAAMEAEENGFTAVVNCAPKDVLTNREYYPDSIKYMECDVMNHGVLQNVIDFIHDARGDDNGKVLIHCTSGINVSAVVVTAYFMFNYKCNVIAAVNHCFRRRPIMYCDEYYVRKLLEFAEQRELKSLDSQIAYMEAAIIEKKRRIAVLNLDCDYEHLTKEDMREIYQNAQQLVGMGIGVVHGDSYPLYAKICDKYATL